MKVDVQYHCEQRDLPVFGCQPKRVSTAEAMNILLEPNLDNDRVCTRQPIRCGTKSTIRCRLALP